VLLGFKDRAELAGNEYSATTSVMEGVVIVEKIEEPEKEGGGGGGAK
jgi:hypothetical protein